MCLICLWSSHLLKQHWPPNDITNVILFAHCVCPSFAFQLFYGVQFHLHKWLIRIFLVRLISFHLVAAIPPIFLFINVWPNRSARHDTNAFQSRHTMSPKQQRPAPNGTWIFLHFLWSLSTNAYYSTGFLVSFFLCSLFIKVHRWHAQPIPHNWPSLIRLSCPNER